MTSENEKRPWGPLPEIDPPNSEHRMCGVFNGNIICCRVPGHAGGHATPFPSYRRHGPVWVYWAQGGPFGSCHNGDPATRLYCGLERGHDGDHLAPTNERSGKTLAEWSAPPPVTDAGRCAEMLDINTRCCERAEPGRRLCRGHGLSPGQGET